MADAVFSYAALDTGSRHALLMTNLSDGTGESLVNKLDASALSAVRFRFRRISWACVTMGFQLYWDATANVLAFAAAPGSSGQHVFETGAYPGPDPNTAGLTGDILLTTLSHAAGASYAIYLDLEKVTA